MNNTHTKHKQKIFLIINLAYIGDVMVCSPLCENIKKYYPDAKLIFITTPMTKQIVDGIPFVDETVIFDKRGEHKGLGGIIKFIKDFKYWGQIDFAFPLLSYERGIFLSWMLGAKRRICVQESGCILNFLLTDIIQTKDTHMIDSLNKHLDCLIKNVESKTLKTREMTYIPSPESIENAHNIIVQSGYDKYELIALCTNTKLEKKDWTSKDAADFINEVNKTGRKVVLVGNKSSEILAREVKAITGDTFLDLTGKTDLATLGGVYHHCKALVSVDTGPMHMGIAMKLPTLALFFYPDLVSEWEPVNKERDRLIMQPKISGKECFEKLKEILPEPAVK